MGIYIEELKSGNFDNTNFRDYWSKSRSLMNASEFNYNRFLHFVNLPMTIDAMIKTDGFFHASLLLRAVSIENLIKSRALFDLKKRNKLDGKGIKDVIKSDWKGISHDPIKICKKHGISLNEEENEFIQNHSDHMLWAGRFPFPQSLNDVVSKQSLGGNQNEQMRKLFVRFTLEMGLNEDYL